MSTERPTIEEKLSQEPDQSEKKIKFEEIAELEEPMRKILEQMLGSIEREEYDLIIGVDASGRIPTLILDKFIRHIYDTKNAATLNTRFVAGQINEENAKEKINEWRPQRKVLIVDDTIGSGISIESLCKVLKENSIKFDVAAVAASVLAEIKNITKKLGASNFYYSENFTPSIFGMNRLSGIKKRGMGEPHSRPYKLPMFDKGNIGPFLSLQKDINQARKDADIVANRLIDWYESQKQKDEK